MSLVSQFQAWIGKFQKVVLREFSLAPWSMESLRVPFCPQAFNLHEIAGGCQLEFGVIGHQYADDTKAVEVLTQCLKQVMG